jgi:hypothetical protein
MIESKLEHNLREWFPGGSIRREYLPPLTILTGPKPTSQSFRVIDLKSFTITEKGNMRSEI